MGPKHSLIGNLDAAWLRTRKEYQKGRINSESTLQAVFFGYIKEVLPGCAVFCEPKILMPPLGTVSPDILVARGETVVAAIEIKFLPHAYPVFQHDLRKLRHYRDFSEPFDLALNPSTGKFGDQRHVFGKECLFIFAVIGRDDADATDEDTLSAAAGLGQCFLPLIWKVPPHPQGAEVRTLKPARLQEDLR